MFLLRRESPSGMGKRLYVGNLPYNADEAMLKEAFGQDGRQVANVHVVLDRETGRPRGFAFVEMASDADAQKALEAMEGAEFGGRNLRVSVAEDRRGPASGPRPGGAPSSGYGGSGYGGPRSGGPPRSDGPPRTDGAPRSDGPPRTDGPPRSGGHGGGTAGSGFSRPKPGWSDPPAEPKKYDNKKTPRRRHDEDEDSRGRRGGSRFDDDDEE